jgi:hypothetical protein
VVKAKAEHETDASGAFVLHAFIAEESPLGAAVSTHLPSDIAIVSDLERRDGGACSLTRTRSIQIGSSDGSRR